MLEFQVEGMTCNHCVAAVTRAVKEVDPGALVRVDLATGKLSVESNAAPARIGAAVEEAGYAVNASPTD